jgi:eukaryotic-like serine/threonine-protein kinase
MPSTCLIGSRYRLAERLGCGGMGSVFRAYDEHDERDVAVKLMARDLGENELAVRRFRREAGICARLRHPNIVAGLASGYDAYLNRHYIVMELVKGDDVGVLAARNGGLPPAEVIGVTAQIADALEYTHAHEVVHGDIAPGNILIRTADHTAKLADFGLARLRWAGPDSPGRVVGTPRYLAPEVARGECATELSDLYSLAAVAHALLTVDAPVLRRSDVPSGVADAILKSLANDPLDRHESIAAFAEDLVGSRLACVA